MTHKLLKLFVYIFILFFLLFLFLIFLIWKDSWNPYSTSIDDSKIPEFEKQLLSWFHTFDSEKSLPMRASTLIDIDWDWIDEIFLGSWIWQEDQIFAYENGKFVEKTEYYVISKWPEENTLASVSADFDNNWYSDLLVSRDSRLSLYLNNGVVFDVVDINAWLNEKTTPLWLTVWDINKDWFLDIFVAWYIKKEQMNGLTNFSPWYGWRSELLLNNGDNSFRNITDIAWLSYVHNTFAWVFVDLNSDTWLDLVVAYDTWEPRIYKNNWDMTFSLQSHPYSNKFAYPMWIALGDYWNDGDVDIFFSNIGSTLPKFMVSWDLESSENLELWWIFLENEWDFKFTDRAEERKLKDYEFSWGGLMHDMNNDWLQDLIVAENYVDLGFHKYFKLPWRFLLQNNDGNFVASWKKAGTVNKNYGITPLVSDFNSDWLQDLVWVNISWESSAYIQKQKIANNYISVRFPETSEYIWSTVSLSLDSGKIYTDVYIIGEWLASDQSSTVHFWIWEEEDIISLTVEKIYGATVVIPNPEINSIIDINNYE